MSKCPECRRPARRRWVSLVRMLPERRDEEVRLVFCTDRCRVDFWFKFLNRINRAR